MGLDMYLKAKRNAFAFQHQRKDTADKRSKEHVALFDALVKAAGLETKDVAANSPSITISVDVAYWRKANAIHGWFVDKVQDGEDECNEHYVSREKLETLVEECKAVLEKPGTAGDKLPPRSGFFFGSEQMDEGYFGDLRSTVEQLGALLANPKFEGWEFYYQSSW